ncbi:MAG: HAD family hydrolase [Epsilonproteobacteria bacterium]|nr:HAD family hydrolase [Campylobacterota bacterium]
MIILFDLDGTLIDSTEAILESFGIAFRQYGMQVPPNDDITSLIGLPLDEMFVRLGVDQQDKWKLVDAYKQHYRLISLQKTCLLPFAKEAIMLAHNIASLGIVTTKTSRYSKDLMRHFGVLEYFDVLIGREDVTYPKPHSEPILKALAAFEEDNEAYMIGDTCLDCDSAKAAGIGAIGVLSGYNDASWLSKCADDVYPDALVAVRELSNKSKN